MCFNDSISILSFLTGISGSIGLGFLNLIPESIFLGWVSNMQLIEYFLWKNQPCQIDKNNKICNTKEIENCNQTNQKITTAGLIINHLEPFILFISILIFKKKTLPLWLIILVSIYLIVLLIYTISIENKKQTIEEKCTYVTEESNPHLFWQWNYSDYNSIIYSLFIIVLCLLSFFGLTNYIFSTLMILISYLISIYLYKNTKIVGSIWCFAAAYVPWLIIGKNII